MKKNIILILCFLGIALSTHAQTRFGIKVGANLANHAFSKPNYYTTVSPVLGFQIGGVVERNLSKKLLLQSGLQLSSKGSNSKGNLLSQIANPIYLELPVQIGYGFSFKNNARFNILGGTYLALGIAGNAKSSFGTAPSMTGKIRWTNERNQGGLKPLDYGLSVGVNFEFEHAIFGLQYGFGLANISTDDFFTIKNRVLSLTVAYMFKKKSK